MKATILNIQLDGPESKSRTRLHDIDEISEFEDSSDSDDELIFTAGAKGGADDLRAARWTY